MIVYLCHFSRKLAHAQHYIGTAKTVQSYARRMVAHRAGRGAKILKACNDQGIKWRVVFKAWGSYTLERQMKDRKNAGQLCPVCKRKAAARRKRLKAKHAVTITAKKKRTNNQRPATSDNTGYGLP